MASQVRIVADESHAAIAVVAYRATSNIHGPLVLALVFTGSFLILSVLIEQGGTMIAMALSGAAFAGIARASYIGLLASA